MKIRKTNNIFVTSEPGNVKFNFWLKLLNSSSPLEEGPDRELNKIFVIIDLDRYHKIQLTVKKFSKMIVGGSKRFDCKLDA